MSFLGLTEIGLVQEGFASAAGRALAICQHFEDCTSHIMVTWGVTDQIRAGIEDHAAYRKLGIRLGKLGLGGGVKRLEEAEDFESDYAAVLERGRVARNWLVHESLASIGFRWPKTRFAQLLGEFQSRLRDLCEADTLASRASYEICEREPSPHGLRERYGQDLFAWAMEPILDSIGALAEDGR